MESDLEGADESVFSDESLPYNFFHSEACYDDSDDNPESDEIFESSEAYASDDADHDPWGSTGGSSGEDLFDSLRITGAAVEEEDSQVVQLESGLWGNLPSELVDKVLAWLPLAGHFRFRCVCKRWLSLLSSPEWLSLLSSPEWLSLYAEAPPRLSYSVMCCMGSASARFFCYSEWKWFKFPLYPTSTKEVNWELVDMDAGLVCYLCELGGSNRRLCVINPLTKSYKVIPPILPLDLVEEEDRGYELVKLHVDRQTNSFKVIVLFCSDNDHFGCTYVYDSTTFLWNDCDSYPWEGFHLLHIFFWKNVMYTRCEKPNILLAFSMESGRWTEVQTDLPWHPMTEYFIVNHDKQGVLLVQMKTFAEERMSVWKLQEEASDFSRSSWMEVPLDVPSALKPVLKLFKNCVSQGDSIFFTNDFTKRWVKYSFTTKTWRVMPGLFKRRRAIYRWFDWEPRLDINVNSPLGTRRIDNGKRSNSSKAGPSTNRTE